MPAAAETPTSRQIRAALRLRLGDRLSTWSDQEIADYLSETVFLERRRFAETAHLSELDQAEASAIEAAAKSIRADRRAQTDALEQLVDRYAQEIHNRFSHRTHQAATRLLPGALTRLLTAAHPGELFGGDFDPASHLVIHADGERLRRLAENHTLILAPTHISNLDSPILGYALHALGLPPFIYGAGLNLFGNRLMGFFMTRLGAYTVDRRKSHRLYKHTLTDYSTEALCRGSHSLFFPGGTRSRTGEVERRLKLGLLGTGITAWQESLAQGRPKPEVLVVPCTLSFTLTLEAETLIEDALAAAGRSRYIITDDEFSEPRTVAHFARRVLNLESAVHVVMSDPVDLLGNPVNEDGLSLGPSGAVIDRQRYITSRDGRVVRDAQRDRIYTRMLSESIVSAYRRDNLVQATHIVAFVAWSLLRAAHPGRDLWQHVFSTEADRTLHRRAVLEGLDRVLAALDTLAGSSKLRMALPAVGGRDRAEAVLDEALARFASFHRTCALAPHRGSQLLVGPRLALYYSNRLTGYGLDPAARGEQS